MKELRQEKTWHLPEHSRAVWLVPIESGWSRVRNHPPPALQGFAVQPQSYGNPLEDFKQRRDLILLLFPCITVLWKKENREQEQEKRGQHADSNSFAVVQEGTKDVLGPGWQQKKGQVNSFKVYFGNRTTELLKGWLWEVKGKAESRMTPRFWRK